MKDRRKYYNKEPACTNFFKVKSCLAKYKSENQLKLLIKSINYVNVNDKNLIIQFKTERERERERERDLLFILCIQL